MPINLHLTQTALSAPFSSILGSPADVTLLPNATHQYDAGLQWTELGYLDMGDFASITYTVACGEVAAGTVIFDNTPAVVPGKPPESALPGPADR